MGLGAAAVATAPILAAGNGQPRIAIIGGGFAGLNAALTLKKHGLRNRNHWKRATQTFLQHHGNDPEFTNAALIARQTIPSTYWPREMNRILVLEYSQAERATNKRLSISRRTEVSFSAKIDALFAVERERTDAR